MNRSPVASHLRVEVKHRCAAPKRYTWEILSEVKTLPVEESADQFRSWEEASQAGKKALEEIISKSCRTSTRGKRVHLIDLRRDCRVKTEPAKPTSPITLAGSNPNHGENGMAEEFAHIANHYHSPHANHLQSIFDCRLPPP